MEQVLEVFDDPEGVTTLAETMPPSGVRAPLTAAPPNVRLLTPAPVARKSTPPPKPARPSVAPPTTPAPPSVAPTARASVSPASAPPPSVAPATSTKATPPPPPSRRGDKRAPAPAPAARPHIVWSGRDAARVSIVKSSTEPGLFYVRLIENGKAPHEGLEGLLVALDPEATLCP